VTDGYTGDVAPGGAADTRDLPGLRVTKLSVGDFDNNVYLLRCPRTGETLLVDGAAEPDRILAELGDGRLVGIVQTHGHWDHVRAIADIKQRTAAAVLCHRDDAAMMPAGAEPDRLVDDGDLIEIGATRVRALHLCGHTPGGLALVYEGDTERVHVFSGDSLFPGGPGNTQSDASRFTRLMDDLEGKVFTLPDSTWVYPGHGKDTTLGAERPSLGEWRDRGW
jgi:glyoxylase-like metal-dependent hydrolase (beta-lactamase superfamily II)